MTENNFNENIFINTIIKHKVTVSPKYLNNSIDEYLLNYLKNELEGKCNCDGYIKKDSLSIIKRTLGEISGNRFTGDISYNLLVNVQICNPVQGSEIDCHIQYINKLGILGHNGPMMIIVSKQFHNDSNIFQKFKEGDVIKVEIIAKKFLFNDKEIQIIGKLVGHNSKKSIEKSNIIKTDKSNATLDEIDDLNMDEYEDDIKEIEMEEEDDIDEDLDKIELEEEDDLENGKDFIDDEEDLDDDEDNVNKKIKIIDFKEGDESEKEEEEEEETEEYESDDE